jgi:hypothetical protein
VNAQATSKSADGPDSMDGQERERRGRCVQTLDADYYDEEEDGRSDRDYIMTDDQSNEVEGMYGVEYDPYYDEPYTVAEFPDDMSFVEDKQVYQYGDRRYTTRRERFSIAPKCNNDLYWRQGGGRPRLRQFWELI